MLSIITSLAVLIALPTLFHLSSGSSAIPEPFDLYPFGIPPFCRRGNVGTDDSAFEENFRRLAIELENRNYDWIAVGEAENESGTGSSDGTPQPITNSCFLNGCESFNFSSTNPGPSIITGRPLFTTDRLSLVNGFPAEAARQAIFNVSKLIYGKDTFPCFCASGPNVGLNLETTANVSGTCHYAATCAKYGLPAFAFSGSFDTFESFTELTNETAPSTVAASYLAEVAANLVDEALFGGFLGLNGLSAAMPKGTYLNVNIGGLPPNCTTGNTKFILTRLTVPTNTSGPDAFHCGSFRLPHERLIVPALEGCFVTVSVANATDNGDVGAIQQAYVLNRLGSFLTCPPASVNVTS